jgi:hypothetical protein
MQLAIPYCESNNVLEKKKLQILPLHEEDAHKISTAIEACTSSYL